MWWLLILIAPYFILFSYIWLGTWTRPPWKKRRGEKGKRLQDKVLPVVTVIIAARNEELSLPWLIGDIARSDYPADLTEVIVVDDRSDDMTYPIAVTASEKLAHVRVERNQGRGKKDAIEQALEGARGELILTTDADCRVRPGWIASMVKRYNESGSDMVIGPVELDAGKTVAGRFLQVEFDAIQAVTAATANLGSPVMCSGANLCFRRELAASYSSIVMKEIPSGDDMFLLQEARKQGRKIAWTGEREAVVTTGAPASFREFFSQRSRWAGKGFLFRDPFIVFTGITTLFTCLAISILLLLLPFIKGMIALTGAACLLKALPDMLLVSWMARQRDRRNFLPFFFLLQLIYPFYVIGSVALSMFRGKSW